MCMLLLVKYNSSNINIIISGIENRKGQVVKYPLTLR